MALPPMQTARFVVQIMAFSHMLGSCTHPMMKAVFIERHNAAARMILKLILEGSHGDRYILADVGSEAALDSWEH